MELRSALVRRSLLVVVRVEAVLAVRPLVLLRVWVWGVTRVVVSRLSIRCSDWILDSRLLTIGQALVGLANRWAVRVRFCNVVDVLAVLVMGPLKAGTSAAFYRSAGRPAGRRVGLDWLV